MRLRIHGIPKLALFGLGFSPALIWCVFHLNSVFFRKEDFIWISVLGLMLAFAFVYSITRGWFAGRYLVYSANFLAVLVDISIAVGDRDFLLLGASLGLLSLSILSVLWLEKKLTLASLNPLHRWFEGEVQLMGRVEAQVSSGGAVYPARLRRIDKEGMFLFLNQSVSFKKNQKLGFQLVHGPWSVEGECRVRASFHERSPGFGLQFLPKDLYHFSQYTALVQSLRGKGL